ncbi:MAG: pilus assembly protein PilM [Planctomycetes bacterium]|nr:pilus assembly protein PilM [Planctomycetota bacterium]
MNVAVGLDVGTKTITGAVMAGSAKSLKLLDFFVEEVPQIPLPKASPPSAEKVDLETSVPPSLSQVVKKLLAARGLQGADVVVSLDAKDCIIREIVMDFTKESDIQRTIKFEAENYLVTMDVDDMVLEYLKVGEQNGKSQLILVAARHQAIADRLALFQEAGVDPVAMDLDVTALFNAFTLAPVYKPDSTCLVIDMGKTTTKVLFIDKGKLKKVRSLRMGAYLGARAHRQIAEPVGAGAKTLAGAASGFQLLDASSIEARFDEIENALRRLDPLGGDPLGGSLHGDGDEPIAILSDEEYEKVTELEKNLSTASANGSTTSAGAEGIAGAGEGNAPSEELRYRQFLDHLGLEIQRTFTTSLLESPIDLICLTGGMSAREEARQYFQENFDVETIHLDFGSGDSFEIDSRITDERLVEVNRLGALAVGLAAKELGRDRIGFDFRQNQFRYERRFEKLKFPLLLTAVLLCACFLQAAVDLWNEYRSLDYKIGVIKKQEVEIYKNFFGEANSSNLLVPQVRLKKTQWDTLLGVGGGDIPAFIDEIETVNDLSEMFREAKQSGMQFEVEMIDLKFRTRPRTGAGAGSQSGGPALLAESDSQIILNVSAGQRIGSEMASLFKNKSRMWEASPTESQSGDKVKLTLKLTPKESYLRSLRS